MPDVPVPSYYSEYTAKERSYVEYMGEINKSISSEIESNSNRQIAASALFAGEIKSTLIDNQIATENALYNYTQQLDGSLQDVSRQLGYMGSSMSMGLAFLNTTVQESSKAICKKLDDINKTLENPLFTQARELYNMALQRYIKGFYKEALKVLHESIEKNETDPFSHFLLGQIYLFGINDDDIVIDLNAAIESLRNAAKYITPDAKKYNEARPIAAEILFYLGLAYHAKANDDLHNSNKADYEKYINEAKTAYGKSWDYSNNMLESLYNLARSKVLTNDEDGAIKDLNEVILKDHGYCLKIPIDFDFNNTFKDKFFNQLKKELYPKIKATYDSIKSIQTEFQNPYSYNLTNLIKKNLPKTLTEDIPIFDMLEANTYFPEILSLLKKEKNAYIEKCKEQERKEREDSIERERRAEQERKNREEEKKKLEEEERQRITREWSEARRAAEEKEKKRRYKTGRVLSPILFALSLIFSYSSFSFAEDMTLMFWAIVPFLIIYLSDKYCITRKVISLIVDIALIVGTCFIFNASNVSLLVMAIIANLASLIIAWCFPKYEY